MADVSYERLQRRARFGWPSVIWHLLAFDFAEFKRRSRGCRYGRATRRMNEAGAVRRWVHHG